jgi:putative endonuclease
MPRDWNFYVYIVASRSRVIYVGLTNDIRRRTREHKEGLIEGFSRRYKCNRLVYYETFQYVNNAINREAEIKKWSRKKKLALIQTVNPTWEDLAAEMDEQQVPRFARNDNS